MVGHRPGQILDQQGDGERQPTEESAPGRQLVFVRYFSTHAYHEWIHNAADIDKARVIWALDSAGANDELKRRYPDRTVWLMEPDAIPPRLVPYPKTHGIFEDVQ